MRAVAQLMMTAAKIRSRETDARLSCSRTMLDRSPRWIRSLQLARRDRSFMINPSE
jgi:hypothetical protein